MRAESVRWNCPPASSSLAIARRDVDMASNQAESDKVMPAFDGATPEMCASPGYKRD